MLKPALQVSTSLIPRSNCEKGAWCPLGLWGYYCLSPDAPSSVCCVPLQRWFVCLSPLSVLKVKTLVGYKDWMDSIAELIGCEAGEGDDQDMVPLMGCFLGRILFLLPNVFFSWSNLSNDSRCSSGDTSLGNQSHGFVGEVWCLAKKQTELIIVSYTTNWDQSESKMNSNQTVYYHEDTQ